MWGANEDARLLLRGLLRLHHCPVVHEVTDRDGLAGLPSLPGPTVLVVDSEGQPPEWEPEVGAVMRAQPELRVLVVLGRGAGSLESRMRAAGVAGVIVRPFAIPDFVRAVSAAAYG